MATAFADGEVFGRDLAIMVKSAIAEAVGPLKAENAELRARCAALEEAAQKAPEIDLTGVQKLIEAEIAKLPDPETVDLEPLTDRIAALEAVEMPDVLKGEPGEDGKSVTLDDVVPLIASEVEKAVAALPVPKDGRDAAGIVDALKDNGELVFTLQDGRLVRTGIRDGEKGKDGRDGFSLDNFDCEACEDGRTVILKFEQGDTRHEYELTFPVPIYRGVYKEGGEYAAGDAATWGGSLWIAKEATKAKPDAAEGGWQLAVKKGRDGKDAKPNG